MDTAQTMTQFGKMLENLDHWLEKSVAFAQAKKFEPDVLAQARLAPDQYELVRQVQSACDAAKFAAAYLSGGKAPSHPDTEKTVAELRARIRTCLQYLKSVKASEYAAGPERRVAPPWRATPCCLACAETCSSSSGASRRPRASSSGPQG